MKMIVSNLPKTICYSDAVLVSLCIKFGNNELVLKPGDPDLFILSADQELY